jgi:hypothetical protein
VKMISQKIPLIITELDNILIDNINRKTQTYLELGWDKKSIKNYLSKKENGLKIATFNTPTVSFSASSRRNRYYTIYNRLDMLDHDIIMNKAIETIQILTNKFEIIVLTARKVDLREKTLSLMKMLGFPIDSMQFHFLPQYKSLAVFRKNTFNEIASKFPDGVAITLNPTDFLPYSQYNYHVIALPTLYDKKEFEKTSFDVCRSWKDIGKTLEKISDNFAVKEIVPEVQELQEEERIEASSMLEKTIFQQLFNTQEIEGVGSLIKNFINDLKLRMKLILRDKLDDFINFFENLFRVNLSEVKETINLNLEQMGGIINAKYTGIYLVLTKLLEELREQANFRWGEQIILAKYVDAVEASIDENATNIFNRLKTSDDDMATIYKFSFLAWLATAYNNQQTKEKLHNLIASKAAIVVQKILLISKQ